MRQYTGLLFDLDNTLMDRDRTFRSFSEQLVRDLLGHLPGAEAVRVVEEIIVRDADGYRDKDGFFAELSEVLPWEQAVTAAEIRAYYDRTYFGHGSAMQSAEEILAYCRERGYLLGLVTNGKEHLQNEKIDLLGLRSYFDTIIISGAEGISKPDPAIYSLALNRLGASADETVFIGDHPVNDIWGAAQAGMRTIWLQRNHAWDDSLQVQPLLTIRELDELKNVL